MLIPTRVHGAGKIRGPIARWTGLSKKSRAGFCTAFACCFCASLAANETVFPQLETPPYQVLISTEHIELLVAIREMAIESGYEIEEVEVTNDRESSTHNLLLIAADPEKALTHLLKRTNHVLEYGKGEPPRVHRVVLLGVGEPNDDFPEAQLVEKHGLDTPDHEEQLASLDQDVIETNNADRTFERQSLDPENAIERLEKMLGAKHPGTRDWAINGLGELGMHGHLRAVLALGQVLFSDPLPSVRVTAVNWLRTIGSDASVAFVDAARNDSSTAVREAAGGS